MLVSISRIVMWAKYLTVDRYSRLSYYALIVNSETSLGPSIKAKQMIRIHYIEHDPDEEIGYIRTWAKRRGHSVAGTLLPAGEELPALDNFDWLVIMGGTMNVYQEKEFYWLVPEKKLIEKAIRQDKVVLGICLGAQLIACVMGADVYPNRFPEIGWVPITLTADGAKSVAFRRFPGTFTPFSWHGDTFNLPSGCHRLAKSEGCQNQAFDYEGRVLGLQFHLEPFRTNIKLFVTNSGIQLVDGRYIQKRELILSTGHVMGIHSLMTLLLNNMEKEYAVVSN